LKKGSHESKFATIPTKMKVAKVTADFKHIRYATALVPLD